MGKQEDSGGLVQKVQNHALLLKLSEDYSKK